MSKFSVYFTRLVVLVLLTASIAGCTGSRKAVREPLKEEGAEYLMGKLKEHEVKFRQY